MIVTKQWLSWCHHCIIHGFHEHRVACTLNPPSTFAAKEEQVPARVAKAAEGVEGVSTYAVSVWARLFSLEKKPPQETWSQSLNSPWQQSKGKQSQPDHCPSQLEISHPTNLSNTSFEQKRVLFSTSSDHFLSYSWSLIWNPVILKCSYSRTQHSISEDSCGTAQESHSGLSSSSNNRLLGLDKNSQSDIST